MSKSSIQKKGLNALIFTLNLLIGCSIGVFFYALMEFIDMITSRTGYSSSRSETILMFGIPAIIIAVLSIVIKRKIKRKKAKEEQNNCNNRII